jgi:glyoxylase-like metal-dependent hydrolase (beta-lactamase superfamily II)
LLDAGYSKLETWGVVSRFTRDVLAKAQRREGFFEKGGTRFEGHKTGYQRLKAGYRMDVRLIEIKQDMPGFNSFFASWLCQDDLNLIVDVGPASTGERLIGSLASLGVERIDYVLLTHIHIDHCGGLGALLDHYPMAKVICHEKAVEHMVEPSRLWNGSLKVLGEIARAYGPPRPVNEGRLIPHNASELKDLTIIETPGHAIHHLSFTYGGRLFAGEAGGNYFIIDDTEYLRPATPPRFFFEISLASVDRLLSLKDQPICYAHFDQGRSSQRLLGMFRQQLIFWKEVIHEEVLRGDQDLVERSMDSLIARDPNLKGISKMDKDTLGRERFFMANAIKGFIGFFKEMDT